MFSCPFLINALQVVVEWLCFHVFRICWRWMRNWRKQERHSMRKAMEKLVNMLWAAWIIVNAWYATPNHRRCQQPTLSQVTFCIYILIWYHVIWLRGVHRPFCLGGCPSFYPRYQFWLLNQFSHTTICLLHLRNTLMDQVMAFTCIF